MPRNIKKILEVSIFFIGWTLSPFTWWNDAFVNIPLSYLMANLLFYITHLKFGWLVLGSYWFTNALGLFLMYFGGRGLIISSKNRAKATLSLIVFLIIYSFIMIYLDRQGKLLPLGEFFKKYYLIK